MSLKVGVVITMVTMLLTKGDDAQSEDQLRSTPDEDGSQGEWNSAPLKVFSHYQLDYNVNKRTRQHWYTQCHSNACMIGRRVERFNGCIKEENGRNRCERWVTCNRRPPGSRLWGTRKICKALCWSSREAVNWDPSFLANHDDVKLNIDVTTYANNGSVLNSTCMSLQPFTQTLQLTARFIEDQNLSFKKFVVHTNIHNCNDLIDGPPAIA